MPEEFEATSQKYPHIQSDLRPLIDRLESGETPGEQVPGLEAALYKVRLRNTDQRKGKSGGYRVLYYIRTPKFIALMTIYPKSARSDISSDKIKRVIEEYMSSTTE